MRRLWGRTTSGNVQKTLWALGELGLAYEHIAAGGEHGRLDTAAYFALNPNRRVPTLQDGDLTLWESNVIVRYLSAKYGAGSLWPVDPGERAIADQWMDWQQTTLSPELRIVFWGLIRTPPEQRDQRAIDAAVEGLKDLWSRLDAHLAGRSFVAGDRLTMGDIPVGVMCHRYYALAIAHPAFANLERWYERLSSRAAFRTSVMTPLA